MRFIYVHLVALLKKKGSLISWGQCIKIVSEFRVDSTFASIFYMVSGDLKTQPRGGDVTASPLSSNSVVWI